MNAGTTVIAVEGLGKQFRLKRKQPGLRGSLRAMIAPDYMTVDAVQGISLQVTRGEMVAFIGPNGAGKSTTIKMLIGILFPSVGSASVLGLTPWRQRKRLAMRVGSVFGQKPQLWYHLPPIDTFRLLARVYELPDALFQQRLASLTAAFDCQRLLTTPVRKLSLGQRMTCEVVGSLLHQPDIIFLDEPTIGLDVIAKQQIRDTLLQLNQQEGVTIFLTSHDATDIEHLCKRAIVINHGRIVLDDRVSSLKRDFLTRKVVDVRFEDDVDGFSVDGCERLKTSRYGLKLAFDTRTLRVDEVVGQIMARGGVVDITVEDPSMEDIIKEIYTR